MIFRLMIVVGVCLLTLSILSAVVAWQKCQQAVIITPDAPARISPTTTGEVSFKLRSGELITLQGQYHDFMLVDDEAGHSGWVQQSDLMPLLATSANQPKADTTSSGH